MAQFVLVKLILSQTQTMIKYINGDINKISEITMEKRGQTTLFVILGIVIVVLLALFLLARQTIWFPTSQENMEELLNEINDGIIECIADLGDEPIIRIGLQGGYLKPDTDTYRLYNDTTISYLCYDIPDKDQCRNRMLLVSDMETQLDSALKPRIIGCMADVESYADLKPITIDTPKELTVNTKINFKDIEVVVNYPITITSKKSSTKVQRERFTKRFNYPLGDLYIVSHDVIDAETSSGEFDQLFYMIAKKAEYKIYKYRPYPDKLYSLKRSDNDYIFQFFIEGEPS